MNHHSFAAILVLVLAASPPTRAADYAIDPNHTQVLFTYDHFGFSHITGRFGDVSGHIEFDPAAPEKSSVEADVPLASLSTGGARLDQDLGGVRFFDAQAFPIAHFKSNKVSVVGQDRLAVAGDLTIHGVVQPVVMQVTINRTGMHPLKKVPAIGLDATVTLSRSAFGLGAMVPLVGDEVTVHITMEAQQPAAK